MDIFPFHVSAWNHRFRHFNFFNYELSSVPLSLFKESGDSKYCTRKAVIMNKIKREIPTRYVESEVVIGDGGGMLHSTVYWPKNGTIDSLVAGVEKFILKFIRQSYVCLVFDTYMDKSIKSDTRSNGIGKISSAHYQPRFATKRYCYVIQCHQDQSNKNNFE